MSNFMHHRWLDETASELKRSSNSTNVFGESSSKLHNTICCGHWSQVHTQIVLLSTLNHDSFVKSQTPFTQLAYAYTHTCEKGIKKFPNWRQTITKCSLKTKTACIWADKTTPWATPLLLTALWAAVDLKMFNPTTFHVAQNRTALKPLTLR